MGSYFYSQQQRKTLKIPILSRITLQSFGRFQHFSEMFTKLRENPSNLIKETEQFTFFSLSLPVGFQLDQDIISGLVYQL